MVSKQGEIENTDNKSIFASICFIKSQKEVYIFQINMAVISVTIHYLCVFDTESKITVYKANNKKCFNIL